MYKRMISIAAFVFCFGSAWAEDAVNFSDLRISYQVYLTSRSFTSEFKSRNLNEMRRIESIITIVERNKKELTEDLAIEAKKQISIEDAIRSSEEMQKKAKNAIGKLIKYEYSNSAKDFYSAVKSCVEAVYSACKAFDIYYSEDLYEKNEKIKNIEETLEKREKYIVKLKAEIARLKYQNDQFDSVNNSRWNDVLTEFVKIYKKIEDENIRINSIRNSEIEKRSPVYSALIKKDRENEIKRRREERERWELDRLMNRRIEPSPTYIPRLPNFNHGNGNGKYTPGTEKNDCFLPTCISGAFN